MGAHWAPGFRCARRHFLSLTYKFHALCAAQQHSDGRGRAGLSPSARGGCPRLVSALRACAGVPAPAADFFAPSLASACCAAHSSPGSGVAHTGRCTAQAAPCSTAAAQLGHAHACCPAHARCTAGPRARMLPVEAPRLSAGGPALGACLEARPCRSALRRTVTARSSTLLAAPALLLSLLTLELLVFSRMHALAR